MQTLRDIPLISRVKCKFFSSDLAGPETAIADAGYIPKRLCPRIMAGNASVVKASRTCKQHFWKRRQVSGGRLFSHNLAIYVPNNIENVKVRPPLAIFHPNDLTIDKPAMTCYIFAYEM